MDTTAHGQCKGPYRESGFECYATFEAQENTPTTIQSRNLSIRLPLFGSLKGKLQQQQFTDPYQLFEVINGIIKLTFG
jgi:hypothetical protein